MAGQQRDILGPVALRHPHERGVPGAVNRVDIRAQRDNTLDVAGSAFSLAATISGVIPSVPRSRTLAPCRTSDSTRDDRSDGSRSSAERSARSRASGAGRRGSPPRPGQHDGERGRRAGLPRSLPEHASASLVPLQDPRGRYVGAGHGLQNADVRPNTLAGPQRIEERCGLPKSRPSAGRLRGR